MKSTRQKFLILDLPVLHQGCIELFEKYTSQVDGIFILGNKFIKDFTYFEKEIRAINPNLLKTILNKSSLLPPVEILTLKNIKYLQGATLILTNDSITRRFAEKYLKKYKVTFDSAFLRWDEKHVTKKKVVSYERESSQPFDKKMMREALGLTSFSPCWWRQVGAVVVKNKRVLFTEYNQNLPHEQMSYALGDIRDFIKAGIKPEITSFIHSEQAIVAKAAQEGISLKDADLYVTVFPCPVCAKLIALSGIRRCYFNSGHVSFDGEAVLKAYRVTIIKVKL